MASSKEILNIARQQIDTKNVKKFNYDYYGYNSSASWCAVFVWWVFKQAEASDLYYGGNKTAYAPTLLNYHKSKGQGVSNNYQPGDIIFFDFDNNGIANHVGICESFSGNKITTIDGNTGEISQDNGGEVKRVTRNVEYICGAYRPKYSYEEEIDMTKEEVKNMINEEVNKILFDRSQEKVEDWASESLDKAVKSKILDGTAPNSFATREMLAVILDKLNLLD